MEEEVQVEVNHQETAYLQASCHPNISVTLRGTQILDQSAKSPQDLFGGYMGSMWLEGLQGSADFKRRILRWGQFYVSVGGAL